MKNIKFTPYPTPTLPLAGEENIFLPLRRGRPRGGLNLIILFPVFVASYLLIFVPSAFAEGLGFSIYPPILEAVMKPGKNITQVFNIQNLSESDKIVIARIVPFTPEGDSGFPLLRPNLNPSWLDFFSLANSNITFNQPFIIPANQTQQLILNIAISSSATLADHYATLLVSTNLTPTEKLAIPASVINTTIGANILLTVNNTSSPATITKIEDFVPDQKDYLFRYGDLFIADNLSPIHFTATAVNLGQFLTKTSGLIRVSKNKEIISLQGLTPLNLLANSRRRLEGSPSGEIVFQPVFTDFGNHLVEIDIRSENTSSHAQINLLLLPVKITLGLIIGLILLYSIVKITRGPKTKSPP